jgi:predicted amidohydrolase
MTDRTGFKATLYDEQSATKRLIIASVAMHCDRQPDVNRARIADTIEAIMQANPDVELIFFGEMTLGWYNPARFPEYHRSISESTPGETTQMLARLALDYKIYVCLGISELEGETLHNAQLLLNPHGEIQAVHRKRNLKQAEREADYQPGPLKLSVTEIRGVKTGMVICSDMASPATMKELMDSRLDLILLSLADDDQDDFVSKFNARMFDAWVATANRYGYEDNKFWPGQIVISDPLGDIRIAKQGQEQCLIYELRFADKGSRFKTLIRNAWVKTPLFFHILKNWNRARSYL